MNMPTRTMTAGNPTPVPVEYSGKWVAWNADHSQIVAYDETLTALWKIVCERQIPDPVFEKVPSAEIRFVGGLR